MMSLEQSEPRGGGWGEDRQGLGYTKPPGRCGFRSEDNGEPREDLEQRRVRSHPCEHLHVGLSLHSPLALDSSGRLRPVISPPQTQVYLFGKRGNSTHLLSHWGHLVAEEISACPRERLAQIGEMETLMC